MHRKNLVVLAGLLLIASCSGQTTDKQVISNADTGPMTDSELSPETAHPRAKQLLSEEFYWSPVEESGPFGSDDGSDAFHGFVHWRQNDQGTSPTVFVEELIADWGYPPFDFNELDEGKLKDYMSSSPIGPRTLTGQDNAIIAVGFGQFVLEGRVDEDMKSMTKTALDRQLLPSMIAMWPGEYQKTRTEQLSQMRAVVERMNE